MRNTETAVSISDLGQTIAAPALTLAIDTREKQTSGKSSQIEMPLRHAISCNRRRAFG